MPTRAELYAVLDAYLAALAARDPALAPLADEVFNTENNVRLAVGDGLWNTVTARHAYELRFAEPEARAGGAVHRGGGDRRAQSRAASGWR